MKGILSGLSTNQRLALVALVLGVVAIVASPYKGNVLSVNADELARQVAGEADRVTATDLADWIIQGRSDYRLIDIRDEEAYAEYRIPTAENVPMATLMDYPLARNERIVLYSDEAIHAAQAWFLLKAKGYRAAYMLQGGLDAWKDEVLFPALVENPGPGQQEQNNKRQAMSTFFGGAPRSGALESTQASMELPKVELPAGAKVPTAKKKKKKEGC